MINAYGGEGSMAGIDGQDDRAHLSSSRGNPPKMHAPWVFDDGQRSLQTLAYEITVAEVRERERIARGLHDDIGQILTMARFKVGELLHCDSDAAARRGLLEELGALLSQATQAIRTATFELSCPSLQLGLQQALESLAQRMSLRGGLRVRVEGQLPALVLPEPVLAVVFRVVRELALNAQKHANACEAWIRPRWGAGWLTISVCDDGIGFDVAAASRRFSRDGGFGLISAAAQMQAIGGRLEIDSRAGPGTRADVMLPLPATGTLGAS